MNRQESRSVESCPHRHSPRLAAEGEVARCGLLEEFLGPVAAEFVQVERDACTACVDAFPPTAQDVNHVVASLLLCASQQVLSSQGEILGEAECRRIQALGDWAESCMPLMFPDEDDAPGDDLGSRRDFGWINLEAVLPHPPARSGPRVKTWAVGVTTAPRRLPTLGYCLDAIVAGGWPDPVLFVDESAEMAPRFDHLTRVVRSPRAGAWPNYYLALAELTLRQPDADAYAIFQDDALLIQHPGLREHLESALWPGDRPGIVSLYCSGEYTKPVAGWHEQPPPWFWGALAFVFPADVARRFLVDPHVLEHRRNGPENGLAGIDVLIGRFARKHGIPIHFPTPSLVQHIGHVSTLWPTARSGGARRAGRFAGDAAIAVPKATAGVRFLRKPGRVIGSDTHRSGWPYAMAAMHPLGRDEGVLLDDFIEQIFCYEPNSHAHEVPWIGIFHHPPNMPPFWKREHALSAMIQTDSWKKSLPHLRGAIALSEYVAHFLADALGVPTIAIKHPTEVPAVRWSAERYQANRLKHLVQVGWYLKNTQLLHQTPELDGHRRMRVYSTDSYLREYDVKVARHWRGLGTRALFHPDRVIEQCLLTAARYDQVLAENVVAIELFDASANNVVIECISRGTPLIVNRHPAVVEYLGESYPLYFSDPTEIPDLLGADRVIGAHAYLEAMDKSWLSGDAFRESVRVAVSRWL